MNTAMKAHIKSVFYLFCATLHDKTYFNMLKGAWDDMLMLYGRDDCLAAIDELLEECIKSGCDRVVTTLRIFREGVDESKTAQLEAMEVINRVRH